MAINRPTRPCKNPHCGNTLYTKDYERVDGVMTRVWRCTNCNYFELRSNRNRRTNLMRAIDLRDQLKNAWQETDGALALMVDLGHPSGCELVYSSTFNYHMDVLLGLKLEKGKKLSNFDVQYHAAQAKQDLERAKVFVSRYCKIAYA